MNDFSSKIYLANLNYPNIKTDVKNTKGVNMPEDISSIVSSMKTADSYDAVHEILSKNVEEGKLEKLDIMTYRCGDYLISDILTFQADREGKFLKELTKRDFSIAPKFVDSVQFGDFTVLVTKIEGMDGEDLIPFSEGYNSLDDKAKSEAFKDIKKLVDLNLINQALFIRGNSSIYITPKTKQVVIPSWQMLRPIEQNEKKDILDTCRNILFKE